MDALQPLRHVWADEVRRYLLLLVIFAAFYSFAFVGQPEPVRPMVIISGNNSATVDFFYSAGCPHCREQMAYNQVLADEFPTVVWKYHEMSDGGSRTLLDQMLAARNKTANGVPVTIIGPHVSVGFDQANVAPKLKEWLAEAVGNNQNGSSASSAASDIIVANASNSVNPANVNDSNCPACKLPPVGRTNETNSKFPLESLIAAVTGGIWQAASPCAIGLLILWGGMGLVSGRRRDVQLVGIAFGVVSGTLSMLFMSKWLSPYSFLGGWRIVTIILGAFALYWSLTQLNEMGRAHHQHKRMVGEKRPPKETLFDILTSFKPIALFCAAAVMILAVPITSASYICASHLQDDFTKSIPNETGVAVYLIIYDLVYALAPLIFFAVVYYIAYGQLGPRAELAARILGLVMLFGLGVLLLMFPLIRII